MKIKSTRVLIDGHFIPKTIHIQDQLIAGLSDDIDVDIDYGNEYIIPGFIDVHTHGCYGANTMEESYSSLKTMSQCLPWEGVTTFLPTTTTLPKEQITNALDEMGIFIIQQNNVSAVNEGTAEAYGIHLEGPFLNIAYAGAQQAQYLKAPSIDSFVAYQTASQNTIKYITLAPELDRNLALINYLHKYPTEIVISLGHSAATHQQALEAIDAGATSITHVWNGMAPLHHRYPSMVLASLMDDRVYTEVTADGHHLDFDIIKFIIKNKGIDKVVLITDANQAKGLNPGNYDLNGRAVVVDEFGMVRVQSTGSLAGSTAKMNECVRNAIKYCGVDVADACNMASLNPAKMLRIDNRKGRIALHFDADIVILNDDINVVDTICRGKVAKRP